MHLELTSRASRILDADRLSSTFAQPWSTSASFTLRRHDSIDATWQRRHWIACISLVIFFAAWDFSIIRISDTGVTLSMVLCPFIMLTMFKPSITLGGLFILIVALIYPLIVIATFDSPFDLIEFFKSFILVFISSVTLAIIIFCEPRRLDANVILKAVQIVLYGLLIYTLMQVTLATLIGNIALYYPFGDYHFLGSLGIRGAESLLDHFSYEEVISFRWELPFGIYRGIGPYYEASALGRIAITLMLISLFLTNFRRGWVPGVILVILSLSAGTISLFCVILVIYLIATLAAGRNTIRAVGVLLLSAILSIFFVLSGGLAFMLERLSGMFTAGETSSFFRIGGSFNLILSAWSDNIFGVPLGSDEVYSSMLLYDQKIANGVLELSLYYGPAVLVGFTMLLLIGIGKALQGDFARSSAMLFLALCTVVSGSWLQIQFTFTLIPLFWALRQRERVSRMVAGRC